MFAHEDIAVLYYEYLSLYRDAGENNVTAAKLANEDILNQIMKEGFTRKEAAMALYRAKKNHPEYMPTDD